MRRFFVVNPFGATPQEWDHFSLILGLTSDLLPVVSNPDAEISPQSKMRTLGKTPSRYNSRGQVAGIANWTQKVTTAAEVEAWREVSDLGICIQTRSVRALDVDIDNNRIFAKDIHDKIRDILGQTLPCRRRENSSKFLLAFTLDGDYAKRTIRTDHGIIEFLATGQQFIAAGTHPSGARYTWGDALPDDIPCITPALFDVLWRTLEESYAAEGTSEISRPTIRHAKIVEAAKNDPVAQSLYDKGAVVSAERDGRLHIACPFAEGHTAGGDASATTYFPAFTGGFERGHFRCLHAHCAERTDGDFLSALGISAGSDDFPVSPPIGESEGIGETNNGEVSPAPLKYAFQSWGEFINAKPPTFHIKGVLPEAALAVIYGAPSSGKTFFAMDMGFAVAQGTPWRGLRVKQGSVAYIAAEDAHGVRMRARAYAQAHGVTSMPFHILGAAPNFREKADVVEVMRGVRALPDVSLIFVDTWSRVIAGGDENSAKDVTEAVDLCAKLYRSTGATIVLIHHSGKDSTKGARGSTVLLGACDCEIEVTRFEDDREAQVTKLKNAADGERFAFRLHVVPVATDDDGDVVSSCILEHVATQPKVDRKAGAARGVNEKIVLRALDDLSIGGAVATTEVIDAAINHIAFDAADGKRDKRREHVLRALNALTERGILTVKGNEIERKGAA